MTTISTQVGNNRKFTVRRLLPGRPKQRVVGLAWVARTRTKGLFPSKN